MKLCRVRGWKDGLYGRDFGANGLLFFRRTVDDAVPAKLDFQLATPNTYVFLKRFSKVAGIIATPRLYAAA